MPTAPTTRLVAGYWASSSPSLRTRRAGERGWPPRRLPPPPPCPSDSAPPPPTSLTTTPQAAVGFQLHRVSSLTRAALGEQLGERLWVANAGRRGPASNELAPPRPAGDELIVGGGVPPDEGDVVH